MVFVCVYACISVFVRVCAHVRVQACSWVCVLASTVVDAHHRQALALDEEGIVAQGGARADPHIQEGGT
jgi:hypothetical protein